MWNCDLFRWQVAFHSEGQETEHKICIQTMLPWQTVAEREPPPSLYLPWTHTPNTKTNPLKKLMNEEYFCPSHSQMVESVVWKICDSTRREISQSDRAVGEKASVAWCKLLSTLHRKCCTVHFMLFRFLSARESLLLVETSGHFFRKVRIKDVPSR